jgi:UDP-N-acetylmuramyl pentapeptide synthase
MIRAIISLYRPSFLTAIVYMLQSTEYQPKAYLSWFWRTNNFAGIMYRRTLERTKAARSLLAALRFAALVVCVASALLVYLGQWHFGVALLLVCPVLLAHVVVLPLVLGRIFIVAPRSRKLIQQSEQIFKHHTGEKLAIAGSYGKTSMKELLLTVLSAGDKKVVATPANKNVAISHAYFAKHLKGDEDVVIIEYGEGAPGDVASFAATTHPTRALVTGIAPAHLDQYKTLDRAAADIFAVADYVDTGKVYVNADSADAKRYAAEGQEFYSAKGALGWKVSNVQIGIDGTCFTLAKGNKKLNLRSGVLGLHQVGPL